MAQKQRQKTQTNGKESNAVDRLLEVAQKRKLMEEEWNSSQRKQYINSSKSRKVPSIKTKSNKRYQNSQQYLNYHKSVEKEKLRNLIQQSVINQDVSPKLVKKNQDEKNPEDVSLAMKFLKNTKLRPFNSNMTFYGLKKEERKKYISSSLTFYKNQSQMKGSPMDPNNSFRFVQNNDLDYEQRYKHKKDLSPNNHVIYFKPNKSQTVRELLNQMKQEKARNNEVILNSTERNYDEVMIEEPESQANIFSEQQLKMLSRYKRFVPFKKDQNLLWKKMLDGDNIWLKRFKEGWQKKKHEQEGRRSYFKKLIVKN